MRRLVRCAVASAVLALAVAGPAGAWSWPLRGDVLRPFSLGANAYTAGQHRGVDVGGEAGEDVVAPIAGTVTFAGTVPTHGRVVTILTADGLSVTLAHLGTIGVQKAAAVTEGQVVGKAGTSGTAEHATPSVHLGIRVASDDQGYLDPQRFLPPRAVAPPPATEAAPIVVSAPATAAAAAPAAPPPGADPPAAGPEGTRSPVPVASAPPVAAPTPGLAPVPVGRTPAPVVAAPTPAVATRPSTIVVGPTVPGARSPVLVTADANRRPPVAGGEPSPVAAGVADVGAVDGRDPRAGAAGSGAARPGAAIRTVRPTTIAEAPAPPARPAAAASAPVEVVTGRPGPAGARDGAGTGPTAAAEPRGSVGFRADRVVHTRDERPVARPGHAGAVPWRLGSRDDSSTPAVEQRRDRPLAPPGHRGGAGRVAGITLLPLLALAIFLVAATAATRKARRIDGDGAVLRHDADLLRQLDAAHRPRVHHDRRGRVRAASAPARA